MKRSYRNWKRRAGKYFFSLCFSLSIVLFPVSCSDRKVPPPPRHHPELLLEVLEKGAKKDYVQLLPRVKKLRALEPASVFLPQLESAVSLNILVNEINSCTLRADFARALALVERYERIHGPGKQTDTVKAKLQQLVALDSALAVLLPPPRSAAKLARELNDLENLGKKMDFSPKIRNFMEKKRSELAWLKKAEYRRTLFGLWSDTDFLTKTGGQDGAQALAAVFAAEAQRGDDPFPSSLPGVRKEMLSPPPAGTSFSPAKSK